MSCSQSGRRGLRSMAVPSVAAIDLIGASELLSSWPRTRTRRCQAFSCSSRSGRLRSPKHDQLVRAAVLAKRRAAHAPAPVRPRKCGRARGAGSARPRGTRRARSRPPPSRGGAPQAARGAPGRRDSPAEGRRLASKAKIATSISLMTAERSAVASSAPRAWVWSVSPRPLISERTSPRGSRRLAPRARNEKSPSRRARRRFDIVCRGRTTRWRAERAKASQKPATRRVTVARTSGAWSPDHAHTIENTTAGNPPMRQQAKIAWSWVSFLARLAMGKPWPIPGKPTVRISRGGGRTRCGLGREAPPPSARSRRSARGSS